MPAFQYTPDNARQRASGLKDPDADPLISGNDSSPHGSDFGSALGRRQSDSDTDPELEKVPVGSQDIYEFFGLPPDPAVPTAISPNQLWPTMPLKHNGLHGQATPSTDSPTSNSSSSVILDTFNASNRKRKSADSMYSFGDPGPPPEFTGMFDERYQNNWSKLSNSPGEQNTNDAVNGINGLFMESTDVSPSSSQTSSVMDSQYGLLGVSIPNSVHQDSSDSSDSSPLEMPRGQNQGGSHAYSQHSAYTGVNMRNAVVNRRPPPVNVMPGSLPRFRKPVITFQPHYDKQYQQLKVISAPNIQYAKLQFFVQANHMETRVETALDTRLVLVEPPGHVKRLRINKTHLYKAKNQAQSDDTSLAPDTVEVRAVVFCASSLKNPVTKTRDPEKEAQAMNYARALSEAKGGESPTLSSSALSALAVNVEPIHTPCKLCIGREIKRLTRGPQTPKAKLKTKSEATDGHDPSKVESEGMNDEVSKASRRMVTMQVKTQAVVDWQLPPSQTVDSAAQLLRAPPAPLPPSSDDENLDVDSKKKKKLPLPPVDEGTIAVDMALRICCYGRHKNENEGYCVIFTMTDYLRKVVGQTMTVPLNINDSHKDKKYKKDDDKNKKAPPPKPVIETQGLPGEGVFPQQPSSSPFQPQLTQSRSAPNLSSAPQDFNFQQIHPTNYTSPTPPEYNNFPNINYSVPATMTPNRSRAASPSAPTNPAKRQRAHGNDWRIPSSLVMTPVPSEPARPVQHAPMYNLHFTHTTNFNGMNSSDINLRDHPSIAGRQTPSGSVVQASYGTNPSTPHFSPIYFPGEEGYQASESDHGSGVQSPCNNPHGFAAAAPRPSSQPSYHQMYNGHNDEAQFRQHFNINLPNLVTHGLHNPSNTVTHGFHNRPNAVTHGFLQYPPNIANYPGPDINTSFQVQAQQPRFLPRPVITYVSPNSGRTDGDTLIHILGIHLIPGLRVCFGNRPATELMIHGQNGITCLTPRVNRPGRVPVNLVANGRMIAPCDPHPQLFYTYVDVEDQTGPQSTQCYVGGDYSSQANPEYNGGASTGGISQQQQQTQQDQGQVHPWGPQSAYRRRHVSPPAAETPPSYEDATTQEQRDRFNLLRREKDQKTFSTLQAAGDTIADQYASEMFDSPQAESSKAESSKVETSQVETSKAVTKLRSKELSLLEQKREIKGLRSDLKLWSIWIPILIVVITIMVYTHSPAARSALSSKLGAAL